MEWERFVWDYILMGVGCAGVLFMCFWGYWLIRSSAQRTTKYDKIIHRSTLVLVALLITLMCTNEERKDAVRDMVVEGGYKVIAKKGILANRYVEVNVETFLSRGRLALHINDEYKLILNNVGGWSSNPPETIDGIQFILED